MWLGSIVPQIFEDGVLYCGQMKALCSKLVPVYYSNELQPDIDYPHNQEQYYEIIHDNVKTLLNKSFFLQGGKDENMVHNLSMSLLKLMRSSGKNP
jgi:hypothetical protein